MRGRWNLGSYGYPINWTCNCAGGWHRPLGQASCQFCRAERPAVLQEHADAFKKRYPRDEYPLPVAKVKPLDKAFKIIDEQMKKPTIYEALKSKLKREPTNAELKAEVTRIIREAGKP